MEYSLFLLGNVGVKVLKMKLSNKLVEDVVADVAGADVLPLVRSLKNKKNISEFKLAEMINQEVNIVRNMLYRLYHANLVSFTRRKDKKKGWYIYYWTFRIKQIKYLAVSLRKQRLEKLRDRLNREKESHFFLCPSGCMRLDFEQAIGFEFKCPECASIMNQEQNDKKIKEIEEEIKNIEKDVA
jgi:transcription initiation factor TFIIE subunit alpha